MGVNVRWPHTFGHVRVQMSTETPVKPTAEQRHHNHTSAYDSRTRARNSQQQNPFNPTAPFSQFFSHAAVSNPLPVPSLFPFVTAMTLNSLTQHRATAQDEGQVRDQTPSVLAHSARLLHFPVKCAKWISPSGGVKCALFEKATCTRSHWPEKCAPTPGNGPPETSNKVQTYSWGATLRHPGAGDRWEVCHGHTLPVDF